MELTVLMYLAGIAENMRSSLSFMVYTSGILTVLLLVLTFASFTRLDDDCISFDGPVFNSALRANRIYRKALVGTLAVWIVMMLVRGLVPTRNDVYVMAGSYVAVQVANSAVVQETSTSVLRSIDTWLSKELGSSADATTAPQPSATGAVSGNNVTTPQH